METTDSAAQCEKPQYLQVRVSRTWARKQRGEGVRMSLPQQVDGRQEDGTRPSVCPSSSTGTEGQGLSLIHISEPTRLS